MGNPLGRTAGQYTCEVCQHPKCNGSQHCEHGNYQGCPICMVQQASQEGANREQKRIVAFGRAYWEERAGTTSFSLAHLAAFLDLIEKGAHRA